MSEDKFDKRLKQKLESHNSEADAFEIWSAIDKQVDKINAENGKSKKRLFPWWFWGVGLMVAITTCLFLSRSNENNSGLSLSKDNQTEASPSEVKPATEFYQGNLIKEVREEQNVGAVMSKINQNNSTSQNEIKGTTIESFKSINGNTLVNEVINKADRSPQKNNVDLNLKGRNQAIISTPNLNINDKVIKLDNDSNKTVRSESRKTIASKLKNTTQKEQTATAAWSKTNTIGILLPTLSKYFPKSPQSFALKQAVITNFEEEEIVNVENEESNENDSRNNNKNWRFSVNLESGYSRIGRQLKSKSNDEDAWLQQRLGAEKPLEAIHAAFLIGGHHKSGFSIQTGIELTQINERFSIEENYTDTIVNENGILAYLPNAYKDTVAVYGRTEDYNHITRIRKEYNQYRFFEIPVLVGYDLEKENWSLGLRVGVNLNLNLKTNGIAYNEFGEISDLSETDYKSKLGLAYQLSINGAYNFTDNFRIYVGPRFYYNPKNMLENSNTLEQRYRLVGLTVGAQYRW